MKKIISTVIWAICGCVMVQAAETTLSARPPVVSLPALNQVEGSKPNIVVVMADDMGFSDLGCYGGDIDTPVLDTLAAQGVRFTQFSNTAKCHSSRVSLLSGLWCYQAGNISLSKSVTFAQLLKQAGYATGMVGKWHLKGTPHDFGFEKYFGHLSGASPYIEGNKTFLLNGKPYNKFGKDTTEFYLTDANTDHAIQFLKEWKDSNDARPFLLYMAYNAPHTPLQAPEELVRKYRGRYIEGWEVMRDARFKQQKQLGLFDSNLKLPEWSSNQRKWHELTDREKSWEDYRMAIYAAMVDSLDQNIGRLVSELKLEGEWQNTLFLFVSDNGANPFERSTGVQVLPWMPGAALNPGTEWAAVCNTPFRWYKQNVHRGGVTSPGIVHWPAGLKTHGWNDTPAHLVDVMPTLLEVAGIDYPDTFNGISLPEPVGISLVPVLRGESVERDKPIYYNYDNNVGLRDERYKLVSRRGGPWELYDLINDPVEVTNLASAQPERVTAMSAEWYRIANELDDAPEKDRQARADKSVPWGINARDSKRGKTGTPKKDEQPPRFVDKKPPMPLPDGMSF